MRVTGTLLDIENYSGTAKGDDGKPFDYSGQRLHVLEGREVIKVKLPKPLIGAYDAVRRGQIVDLVVNVQAQAGARGAYLTTTAVSDYREQDDDIDIPA